MSNESQETSEMLRDELDRLLLLATRGEACQADRERLNDLLRSHKELCSHAACYLRDEALLRDELKIICAADILGPEASSASVLGSLMKGQSDRSESRAGLSSLRKLSSSGGLFLAGLAACLAITALSILLFLSRSPGDSLPVESTDDGVAVLTQVVDVEWDQANSFQIGDTIPASVLKLKSGLAQIEFYSGASMLLEGPAELQVISADQCFFRSGKLRIVVPRSAQGFAVLSPDIDMVDLGTEFGVEVTPQGNTQVHVFDGKVELYPPDTRRTSQNRIELLAGSAQQIEHSGESSPIVADPKAFISMREMKQLTMKQDPRFVAIYSFTPEVEQDRVLHNHGIRGRSLDGAVVGCEWSEGRWPGKRALEFKRPGDRVCIHVPGEYDALTLAAWIRVDGLDREYSSLILTDGWEPGEIHWQILRSGQLRLGICHSELAETSRGFGFNYDSPAVWDLSRIGQWIHVAVVVDNPSGFVTHFANGRELSREPLHEMVKMRVGDAQIGNWRPYLDSFYKSAKGAVPIRNFNGRIDEFMIAGQALTNEDIKSLYQKGKPTLQK